MQTSKVLFQSTFTFTVSKQNLVRLTHNVYRDVIYSHFIHGLVKSLERMELDAALNCDDIISNI